ncbi:MAG: HAMP domain-containing histidine kinase [Bacteroidales bacterium]|nr:HAMP domain-containing histidine kinase [Bacteroidales bacterium]
MKLLNKTTLIVITVTLFIFFLGGIGFFHVLRTMINQQIDSELKNYSNNLVRELVEFQVFENAMLITENNVKMEKIANSIHIAPYFIDTIIYDSKIKLYSPHRMYRFHALVGDQNFKISVFRSTLSSENLIERIIASLTLMLVVFIIAMFFMNRYFFKRIWDDFFFTVEKINSFNWQHGPDLKLPPSEIQEFQNLNQVINKMTERIHKDFANLKEFTENASHELQTPLAIMRSKIELLLQTEKLDKEQIQLVSSLYESVNRLANMNKTLILLTKIENNQFPETRDINLKDRITFHLENFEEMMDSKEIKISLELQNTIKNMNPDLADILMINLIKNAIRHNQQKGIIDIKLNHMSLTISNSGPESTIPANKIFHRFTKRQNSKDSLGLGLSIVKKICDLYACEISYSYNNQMNVMHVDFSN